MRKMRLPIVFLMMYLAIFVGCKEKAPVSPREYTNTVSYGIYDDQNQLIDVGTKLTKGSEFEGSLEVDQDINGIYQYYLNILVDGEEFPYELEGTSQISATDFWLDGKESVRKKLRLKDLTLESEVSILLFKYPKDRQKLTVDTSLNHSVMGLRYNVGDEVKGNQKLQRVRTLRKNIHNIDFILTEPEGEPLMLALNKKTESKVRLLLGKNQPGDQLPDRNQLLAFLNGQRVAVEEISKESLYEVYSGQSFDLIFRLPDKTAVNQYGHLFQLVFYHPTR